MISDSLRGAVSPHINVALNWFEELQRLVSTQQAQAHPPTSLEKPTDHAVSRRRELPRQFEVAVVRHEWILDDDANLGVRVPGSIKELVRYPKKLEWNGS